MPEESNEASGEIGIFGLVGAPDLFPYKSFLPIEVVDNFELNVTPPYKDKTFLHQKYVVEELSPRQIASRYFFSRQSVYKYLRVHNIPLRQEDVLLKRQVQYGKRNLHGLIVPSKQELKNIEMMLHFRGMGFSYEKIAETLNAMNVKTKRGGKGWYAHTVHKILKRTGRPPSAAASAALC